jgi:hypothetical protein
VSDIARLLDREADRLQDEGQQVARDIERREAELFNLRGNRDIAFRRAAEARVGANILREVGLRSETTSDGHPFVAMDYTPKRPEPR